MLLHDCRGVLAQGQLAAVDNQRGKNIYKYTSLKKLTSVFSLLELETKNVGLWASCLQELKRVCGYTPHPYEATCGYFGRNFGKVTLSVWLDRFKAVGQRVQLQQQP
ncbi:hypothetical protein CTI12_AA099380 [Artemisia annua]|uniref:Uncharacterized protein n=1 Tax=Artemisia annua TaxID=35608 RepID=A0A2U1PVB2_ARTAN|nr:hypothetical protein CTI12_AA099380 [Artemisia annua]